MATPPDSASPVVIPPTSIPAQFTSSPLPSHTSDSQSPEQQTPSATPKDLRNTPDLWYRINVFVFDLRNFNERPLALSRLDDVIDPLYVGMPYFTEDEVAAVKQTIVQDDKTLAQFVEETLNERLERRMKERVDRGDFRVCCANDLAPIFEKALDIEPRELVEDTNFMKLVDSKGLQLDGEVWESAGKDVGKGESKGPNNRKRKR